MIPGFSVKFVINRITGNYKIQITDTTDYSGVATAYGFYRIEYPDGIYMENTDVNNPDFEIGQNFSEFNLRLKNSLTMAGQYRIIQKTFADTGDIETTKVITFSFVEPELKLTNTSNLAVPTVSFTDTTNYNLGFYTEAISKVISSNFPAHLPFSATLVTTTTSVLTMLYSGGYYEGVYEPTLSSSVVFTGTEHVIEWAKSSSFTFDVRKLLSYTELLSYMNVAKARYDQAKGTTNESKERENYQLVASLIDHIQFKAVSINQGIAELMLEVQDLIYKITCTYIDDYDYSDDPIPPIDDQFFTEGVPLSRILTINGVSYDLTQDRTWNVGTVTSVNIQVPTWMTVVGGPITESGSFQLGLAAGYYIPTLTDKSEWDTAYDKHVTAVAVTGTLTKTITLTRNDGTTLIAQWDDIDTFPVTSVNGKTGDVVLVTDDISEDASPVNLWFTQARARASVDLTTIGNSGAATYSSSTGIFNIPNYTLAGLGGVPLTRTLTINGVSFDLSSDRIWNVGTVTQINTGSGLTGGPITGTGTISHADTSALSGLIGGAGIASITVDEFGHVTAVGAASYVPTSRTLTINGQSFDLSANRSWSITPAHIIQNNGTVMTHRDNLNFVRMTVTDDSVNNRTTITRPPSVTISASPPTVDVLEGDEWINNNTWSKYAWYDGYWVQVNKKCGFEGEVGIVGAGIGLSLSGADVKLGDGANVFFSAKTVAGDDAAFILYGRFRSEYSVGDTYHSLRLDPSVDGFRVSANNLNRYSQTRSIVGTDSSSSLIGAGMNDSVHNSSVNASTFITSPSFGSSRQARVYMQAQADFGRVQSIDLVADLINSNGIPVIDSVSYKGMRYGGNYSVVGVLDDRWIPDWGAVKDYANSVGVDSANVVKYTPQTLTTSERNQARVNIGSTSATPQIVTTIGAIDNLTITSNAIVFTGAGEVSISGIVAGLDGEEISILNLTGNDLTILGESALSTSSNRFSLGAVVPAFSRIQFQYRTTTNRWIGDTGLRANITSLTINAPNDTAASNMFVARNIIATNPGGMFIQQRGSTLIRARGDSLTGYYILRLQNNNSAGVTVFEVARTDGSPWCLSNSAGAEFLTRRQELVINYGETVATAGTINNLAIAIDTKLLILTAADDLTGIVGSQGRLLRIEARGVSPIIRDQSASSADVNRFALGADLTINAGEVYQFIYTDSRWRRIL